MRGDVAIWFIFYGSGLKIKFAKILFIMILYIGIKRNKYGVKRADTPRQARGRHPPLRAGLDVM